MPRTHASAGTPSSLYLRLRRNAFAKVSAARSPAVSAQAVLSREKRRHRADITVHARGEKFLHGFGASGSWETSVNEAIDKIAQQAHRVKGKWQERKRHGAKAGAVPAAPEPRAATAVRVRVRLQMPRILRTTRQAIKAMSLADAARAIDAGGDGVVVFRDTETTAVSVMYRRKNGELALVETE